MPSEPDLLFGLEIEAEATWDMEEAEDEDGDYDPDMDAEGNDAREGVYSFQFGLMRDAMLRGVIHPVALDPLHPTDYEVIVGDMGGDDQWGAQYGLWSQDSTVTGGEFVTAPCSLGVHAGILPGVITEMESQGFEGSNSTGMHIHVGRDVRSDGARGLNIAQIGIVGHLVHRLAMITNKVHVNNTGIVPGLNVSKTEARLAGLFWGWKDCVRPRGQYHAGGFVNAGHYNALNLRPRTVEIRLPTSTMNAGVCMAQLEAVAAMCRFAQSFRFPALSAGSRKSKLVACSQGGDSWYRDKILSGEMLHASHGAGSDPAMAVVFNPDLMLRFIEWLSSHAGRDYRHEQAHLRTALGLPYTGRRESTAGAGPEMNRAIEAGEHIYSNEAIVKSREATPIQKQLQLNRNSWSSVAEYQYALSA